MASNRKKKGRKLRILGAVALLLALGALFFMWQQESIVSPAYTVVSADLPEVFDGLRMIHLSDLHGKEFGKGNERLLKKVAESQPDLIAITGDLIDREEHLAMVPTLAKGLAAIAPTYYVTGNHEWAVHRVNDLKGILTQCGVTVLSGEYVLLERDGETIAVAGMDDPNGPEGLAAGVALKEKISKEQGDIYTLFLSHRDSVETYAQWGFDLTLCGHGHGGIWRIPLLDRGLLSTDRTFFPEYDGGAYDLGHGNACVISRGLGSNTVPIHAFRLFNRPDLPLIILQRRDPA